MIYYLFTILKQYGLPGSRLMDYITFRSGVAFVLALLIAIFIGRKIIDRLQLMQVGEIIRNLDLEGQQKKTGTPTMGGIIIIAAILIPALLVGNLANVYMLLMIVATLWLGTIGFLDDYKKIKYRNKDGMKGKYKIIGQIGIAVIVAVTMFLNPDMVIVENREVVNVTTNEVEQVVYDTETTKSPQTTIPFVKNNNFDYSSLTSWMGRHAETGGWIIFFIFVIFFVSATSNGANLNDGLDGMTSGLSAIIGVALAIMAYLGGNVIYSSYLNIMYIPGSEELVVYMAAFIGALVGFLWYNAYPAQVFMGDTGSLTIGGIIAVYAIIIHKELLIPILCGIFLVENLSVILQRLYYKAGKRKGVKQRLFKRTPIHDHFRTSMSLIEPGCSVVFTKPDKLFHESKITIRFWIVTIVLAAITIITLKIR